jgi:Mg2+/citrate symporter
MENNNKQNEAKPTGTTDPLTPTAPLEEKITAAITKDDDLLNKLLKTLTNPLVMIVGIVALVLWLRHKQKSAATEQSNEHQTQLKKLQKKQKKQQKKNKYQSTYGKYKHRARLIS